MRRTAADAITAGVLRDASVEVFGAFIDAVGSGSNGYIDVGLTAAEGDNPAVA